MSAVKLILDSIADEAAWADCTDGQLLDLFVRLRDEEAFAAVVRRHGPMVLGVCRRVLRNTADADDAFQAAFLVLARKAASIGTRDLLAQWLYGVAYNTARKLRQSNTRRALHELPLSDGTEPPANTPEPRDELLAILDEELNLLPDRYRAVLVLCDLEGLTRREAAQLLNCPEGTVGGRLARARALLAERLERRGVVSAAGVLVAVLTERVATAIPLAGVMRAISVDDLARAAAQGLISPRVAQTTDGVLKGMFATKLRTTVAAVLCCGLALACGAGAIHFANAQPDPKPAPAFQPAGDKPAAEKAKPAEGEKKLTVFPLKTLDAKDAAATLVKTFPVAVTVAPVRDENAIIVYATAKDTAEVRDTLRKLGEVLPKDDPKPAPKKFAFRMRNAKWDDVFEVYSKLSGLTLITTVKPREGTFTFDPPAGAEFTLAEITDIINEALEQKQFILIRRHMTFFIHPADEKLDPTLVPRIAPDELEHRGRTEMVQVILLVRGVDLLEAQDAVKKMLSAFGSTIALKNAILVHDTAGRLVRIRDVLVAMEKAAEPKKDAPKAKTYTIAFRNTPWADVLDWYSKESGLMLITTVVPKGTATIMPGQDRKFTFGEITDLINEALAQQKFILVRRNKSFFLHPADEKIDPTAVRRVELSELPELGRTEIVEVMLTLKKLDAGETRDELRKLLTPFGMIVFAKGKTLVVCDTAGNIARIREVIEPIDEPAPKAIKPDPRKPADTEPVLKTLTLSSNLKRRAKTDSGTPLTPGNTMHIQDIFDQHRTTFSFEFFPPKTDEASEELFRTIAALQPLQPSFVSVTYGAGGSTRERTHDLVVRIEKETDLTAVSHLTCVCHNLDEMTAILDRYAESGIQNILALSGDPPKSRLNYDRAADAFRYAEELVRFVKSRTNAPDRRGFGIGVAGFPEGHPGCANRMKEMDYLKAKVDAGADYICTQLFFDNRDFHDFRDRCELAGIKVPIVAGIMPMTSRKGMIAMADMAAGTRYPAKLLRAVARCADDDAVARVGISWATEQCADLLHHGVRGIHFYTLNRSDATRQIYQNLGVESSAALRAG